MSRSAIEVETADGIELRGEMAVRGRDWALLVHDLGEDIDAWRPVADRLAADGMSVVALDLRGHGGSDGDADQESVAADVVAARRFVDGHEPGRLYVLAAGRSCAAAAHEGAAGRCAGLVALAPVHALSDWGGMPRLAVVGSTGPQQAVAESFRRGPGWAVVAHVPFSATGLAVLRTPWGSNVLEYVAGFLKGRRLARDRVA